jgi:hypothetical protein
MQFPAVYCPKVLPKCEGTGNLSDEMRRQGKYIKGKSVEPIIHVENAIVFLSHFLEPLQKSFLISLESRLELIHGSSTHSWANGPA